MSHRGSWASLLWVASRLVRDDLMYNGSPFLSLPAGTGRQPHQSGWCGYTFFPASARIGAMRAHHADLQQKSGTSSPVPGLSPTANEVATTPE